MTTLADSGGNSGAAGATIHTFWSADVRLVQRIAQIPRILKTACLVSGMRFCTIGRVTPDRWTCCAVHDEMGFGLKPGTDLALESTLCKSFLETRQPIVIDEVACDPGFADHPAPKLFRFRSSISMPIVLRDQSLFGSLCAIDEDPRSVSRPEIIESFRLFAELVASHIDLARMQEAEINRPIGE